MNFTHVRLGTDAQQLNLEKHAATVLLAQVNKILQTDKRWMLLKTSPDTVTPVKSVHSVQKPPFLALSAATCSKGACSKAWTYLSSALLGELILQAPHAILVGKALLCHAHLGQDAHLKATHAEQQVGVVPTVHAHKAVVPVQGCQRPAQKQTTESTLSPQARHYNVHC